MYKNLILIAAICSLLTALPSFAEQPNLPVVDESWVGYDVVTGQASPGSAPITIYDLSYPARTALGSGKSMDDNGYFAVIVSPPLIAGHEIIAEDKGGHTSQPIMVTTPNLLTDSIQ